MSAGFILFLVTSAVALLLFLVLKLKISAFISLLITAIYVGLLSGMAPEAVLKSIQEGMGSTLGFVATVVGLGAIFGQILETSGGAEALAHSLVRRFGQEKAPWAMALTGFLVAIPVFFDVGFIILVPIVYALARDTRRSLLYYAIPLLAGLAATHTFVPPTPGPVAVADIINVQLGWVILFGLLLGIPTTILAGPVWGRYISGKIFLPAPGEPPEESPPSELPSFGLIASLIGVPLFLILLNTLTGVLVDKDILGVSLLTTAIRFLGHPFTALIIATLLAIWLLGLRRGMTRQAILELSNKALGPAGLIILITGAGGVLKQILVDSGMGKMMAESMAGSSLSPIFLAWLLAAVVRITQGSATVAMITAAGIIAPVLQLLNLSDPLRALVVIAIASGATILSHVNDSGFWLVGKYLGMNEKDTLRSWTVMETIIAVCGLVFALLASLFF
ncbi:MAG TPA: gluconate:H+ symporter [Prolixibacteraceae bacterium]|jgi:Gnt-I system low-affinity gluconate transporter|nr:gluconate:H+ symporter [Prolixibacteraceae bacterium]